MTGISTEETPAARVGDLASPGGTGDGAAGGHPATVLLLAHGSPDPRHADRVGWLAHRLCAHIERPVGIAFLDHHGPTLEQAVVTSAPGRAGRLGVAGASERLRETVGVVPLLLSRGFHARHDVPAEVEGARSRTGRNVDLLPAPLLTHGAAWAGDLVREAAHQAGQNPSPKEGALLVTAGMRSPHVLAQWDTTAERLTKMTAWGRVEVAHATGPGRRPTAVIQRMRSAGIRPAFALPLLIADGVLGDRIATEVAQLGVPLAPVVGRSRALRDRLSEIVREQPA